MRRSSVVTGVIGFALVWGTWGCSRDSQLEERHTSIGKLTDASAQLAALLALDQEFPDNLELKVDIGRRFLSKDDPLAAEPFLKRGESLLKPWSSAHDKTAIYGGLAELAYAKAAYSDAQKFSGQATNQGTQEGKAYRWLAGRALLGQKRTSDAILQFDGAWADAKDAMTPEDYRAYARTLVGVRRYQDVVLVLESFQAASGFEPGSGLLASSALEALGDIDGSVLAAWQEALYGRDYGRLSAASIAANFSALTTKLADARFNPDRKGFETVKALEAWTEGNWAAFLVWAQNHHDVLHTVLGQYLYLSARLETNTIDQKGISDLQNLAPSLHNLPGYWLTVYRAVSKLPASTFDQKILFLEAGIDLEPTSPVATQCRQEIAVLVGLPSSSASVLLSRGQMLALLRKAGATADARFLNPIYAILALPDNQYVDFALGLLRGLVTNPLYKNLVQAKVPSSSGLLATRLKVLVGNQP